MSEPAYTRLDVDERRRRLLERGADLFARHSYDELSMAAIAREAGVSKALLYHYFPSKQDFFGAVLAEGAAELVSVVDADAPPRQPSSSTPSSAGWEMRERLREARARRVARGPRPHGRGARRHRGADPRRPTGPRRPSAASRSTRGCGSWTARSSTGSNTATSTARPLRALLLRALEGALGEPL